MWVRVHLAGALSIETELGKLLEDNFRGLQERLIFVYLISHHARAVSIEELEKLLWPGPDAPPDNSRNNIAAVISRLGRKLSQIGLRSAIDSDKFGGYKVRLPADVWIDMDAALASISAAYMRLGQGNAFGAFSKAKTALAILRLSFLPGFESPWISAKRAELQKSHEQALDVVWQATLSLRQISRATQAAEEMISLDDLNELAYQKLMLAHALEGNRSRALTVYESCREVLKNKQGADPSPETERLFLSIVNGVDLSGFVPFELRTQKVLSISRDFHVPTQIGETPNNVPLQSTNFIGREREIADVKTSLVRIRLLTLTGAPGSGKTRLAIEVARILRENYPEGVWVIDLGPLGRQSLVPQTVAATLGLPEKSAKTAVDQLVEYLGSREVLLVLDNCEHLIDACAHLVGGLLAYTSYTRILTTSRQPLGNPGEIVRRLNPLTLPDVREPVSQQRLLESEAGRLFVDRASAVSGTFFLTDQNSDAIARICVGLDGLPLAIELAAARAGALSTDQIAEHLQDRFRLLKTRPSSTQRYHTLEAAIEWSHNLLSTEERILFRRMAVFSGPFALEDAEAVCSDQLLPSEEILDPLVNLADKSLVVVDDQSEFVGYRLLESIRSYAQTHLEKEAETLTLRKKHMEFFTKLSVDGDRGLSGADQKAWLKRLGVEHDNFRAALDWSFRFAPHQALRLSGSLGRFWEIRGFAREGRAQLDTALSLTNGVAPTDDRAKALLAAGRLAIYQGDYESANRLLNESLNLYRVTNNKRAVGSVLGNLGRLARRQGNYPEAESLLGEGLELARDVGDVETAAYVLNSLGLNAADRGEFPEARSLLEESRVILERKGDRMGVGMLLNNLGLVSYRQGDLEAARGFHEGSMGISTEFEDKQGISTSLTNLGVIADELGDYDRARSMQEQALAISKELGDKDGIAVSQDNLGQVAHHEGNVPLAWARYKECLSLYRQLDDKKRILGVFERVAELALGGGHPAFAARLLGVVQRLRSETGAFSTYRDEEARRATEEKIRSALEHREFTILWKEGVSSSLDTAIHWVLEAK